MSARHDTLWRGIALLGLATGVAALVATLVLWNRLPAPAAPTASVEKRTATSAPATPIALAGHIGTLSRLLSERRAVARAELVFGAKGVLDVTCRVEAADGALSACFGDEKGTGTWSLTGSTLCLSAAALNLAASTCYELSGAAPQFTLAGPGFLAGSLLLR